MLLPGLQVTAPAQRWDALRMPLRVSVIFSVVQLLIRRARMVPLKGTVRQLRKKVACTLYCVPLTCTKEALPP